MTKKIKANIRCNADTHYDKCAETRCEDCKYGALFNQPAPKENKAVRTAEEILKKTFEDNFLDLDYLDLYLKAMEEYANQFK